jgi:cation diffusion facilitator CzcD-associated flavoprotein CzcO
LDLSRDISFSTWVRAAHFDETERLWMVESETADGTRIETRVKFFVVCCGHGFAPYIPNFKGLEEFTDACHHTAQWPQQGLSMADKRVGVIGTGASGIQVAQEAAKVARSLTVFQRTPALCLPMRQRSLDDNDNRRLRETLADSLKARESSYGGVDFDFDPRLAVDASERERRVLFESLWARGGLDYWLANYADSLSDPHANAYVYEFWRDKVRAHIHDPALAESLAPTIAPHPFGTRPVALEQTYYDLFNEEHVELVDIQTNPIEAVTVKV